MREKLAPMDVEQLITCRGKHQLHDAVCEHVRSVSKISWLALQLATVVPTNYNPVATVGVSDAV